MSVKYTKMNPVDHILTRSDMYCGSTRSRSVEEFVVTTDDFHIEKKTVTYSPALLRIFIEPLSNVIDNVARSKKGRNKVTKICVNIDEKTGETTFWNDGESIAIEKHPEEKCYNHTLIFGNLLTSSNYDDDEERYDISGRNGVGIKVCLKRGTLVPDFFGNILKIEDVQIGDKLIGDDGESRTVLNKVEGTGRLYEVLQSRGKSYIVNENHILCVRMPDHKVIFWNTAKNGWSMLWLNQEEKKIHMKSITATPPQIKCPECGLVMRENLNRHFRRKHFDKPIPKLPRKKPTLVAPDLDSVDVQKALARMKEFADTIPDDNTLDINIQEYMKLTPTMQGRLTGYVSKCVNWEEKEVFLDPYVLGLWLGDGSKCGRVFASDSEIDPEVMEYLRVWGKTNDATFKQGTNKNRVYWSISSTSKCRVAPLKKLLLKYNLVNNKHIPREYLINSRRVRLAVLAGIIDTDGGLTRDGRRITIAQGMNHETLANDIIFLARSLGFMCCDRIKNTQWEYKGEIKRGKAVNINISGNGIEDIPTLIPRKKCAKPLKNEVTNMGNLTIREVKDGEYVGVSVDGNRRFVLEDFTVTHNCNVFSSKFCVSGYDPKKKKLFSQTWTNNMKTVDDPIVTKSVMKTGFTSISYIPDFKQFEVKGYDQDILSVYKKYIVDMAMLTKVPVYFNNDLIPIKDLYDYAHLYSHEDPTKEVLHIKTTSCEVVLMPGPEYQTISFANGVCTTLGGTHVDSWSEKLFRPLLAKFNKKNKAQLSIKDIKNCFRLFVVASVVNPEYESQNKLKLERPIVPAVVKKSYIDTITKWSIMSRLEDMLRAKEFTQLKKLERKKRGYTKVEGLDAANNEGGRNGHKCTLILVEGVSAKSYAVTGIDVGAFGQSGRDYFGIYTLRGKCLAPNTPILLWNGQIKLAKDIIVGDILVNDLGRPTTVLNLFAGVDEMYEIQQTMADNYTVNSQHTLTLKISGHRSIVWDDKNQRWRMGWFDKNTLKKRFKCIDIYNKQNKNIDANKILALKEIETLVDYPQKGVTIKSIGLKFNIPKSTLQNHYAHHKKKIACHCGVGKGGNQGKYRTKEQGYQEMLKFRETIDPDDTVDIPLSEYMKMSQTDQHSLKGFRSNTCIQWPKQKVLIDPYILGMWLGDGWSTGFGLSSADDDLINEWVKWGRQNDAEIVHSGRYAFYIRREGFKSHRHCVGSHYSSNKACTGCKHKLSTACSNDSELESLSENRVISRVDNKNIIKNKENPLRYVLAKYNLINNKHIPDIYIINDKQTRLQLLAGFIDTDGCVLSDGRIEIAQCKEHKNMIDSLVFIGRSLGFSCRTNLKKCSYTHNGIKKYKTAYRLTLSGHGVTEIPTKLYRKQVNNLKFHKQGLNSGIQIIPKGIGNYVGFETDGNHRFLLGDFTVTHNCLNCRNASVKQLTANSVINDIIKSLGLRQDVNYIEDKNYKTLRYGRVMLVTDADVDGLHISGLILNMFHTLFPSLLERKEPYIVSMQTPIVRVMGKRDILFYDEREYRKYVTDFHAKFPNKKITHRYYKGLAGSNEKMVLETFGKKLVCYDNDEHVTENMVKVFHKNCADARKEWLTNYDPENIALSWSGDGPETKHLRLSDFLNTEMIKFSLDDCKRSIPHVLDGLKESQRKILYVAFLKGLDKRKLPIKVAQFGAQVALYSGYHHGESNLYDTMVKMAQTFPGSNNVPLFVEDGGFGTRTNGGKDSGAARYLHTMLESVARLLFHPEDDELMECCEDDGDVVEPYYYIPIIPMILANGVSAGIGTGWSSNVPNFNPLDLITSVKIWLENEGKVMIKEGDTVYSMLPEITPWYRAWNGVIEKSGTARYITRGNIIEKSPGIKIINELPIGLWTDKFKDSLDTLLEEKQIDNYKNNSSNRSILFEIRESSDGLLCNEANMKLTSYLYTSNMVMFTPEGLRKFNSVDEIIDYFCQKRYALYVKRKANMLRKLNESISLLGNKKRFMEEVIEGKVKVFKKTGTKRVARPTSELTAELEERKYDKVFKKKNKEIGEDEEGEEEVKESKDHGYGYLLGMQFRSITAEKINKLKNDIAGLVERHDELEQTTEAQMWTSDLDAFAVGYAAWQQKKEKENFKVKKPRKRK